MLCNSFIPPKTIKWFNFLSLAFPGLIIAYVLLTVMWIIGYKKRAIFFLLGLLLFFNPIRRWINYSPSQSKGNFKMVTFNVHAGKDIPNLETFLEAENPDVIFMQEKGSDIKARMPLKGYNNIFEEEIIAIYSKFPIKEKGNIVTNLGNGHAQYADIDVNGKTIRFINMYLEPFYLNKTMVKPSKSEEINKEKAKKLGSRMAESFRLHQDQIAEVRKFINNSPYPVIVGGDFNSVPNSYEYYHVGKDLNDAFMDAGSGSATSFHDYKFPIRIDYLFSSPSIKATKYEVNRNVKVSDHFPVISYFNIK